MRFQGAMVRTALAAAAALAVLATSEAHAQDALLKVGDRAPAFEAVADNGKLWKSRDNVGKRFLVVYFYPAAMTAGCTTQACLFRDNRTQLTKMGADVIGVSGDRVANLKAFKGSNRLNFPLLSDTAGAVARAFGVPVRQGATVKRTVDGKEVELTRDVTTARWTYIIDPSGKIVYKATDVNPEGDPKEVLAVLQRLTQR